MPIVDETTRIRQLLDQLPRPTKGPKVVGFHFELGTDQAGDRAVNVIVILDDATKDKDWTLANLDPIADSVRAAIQASGIDRWPYVRFARQRTMRAAG